MKRWKCPLCGRWPFTGNGLQEHLEVSHHVSRLCLICGSATHKADALCSECQRMPQDDLLTALAGLVRSGDLSDWSPRSWNHWLHMTDEKESYSGDWRAQLAVLLGIKGVMYEDG